MQMVKKSGIALIVAWFAILVLMPKQELYYKLEEALAVDKVIKGLAAVAEAEEKAKTEELEKKDVAWDAKHLMGTWYCNGNRADLYHFHLRDNKTMHAADIGKWKHDGKVLTVEWENGYRLEIELDQTGNTIRGKSHPPGATRYEVIRLTRMTQQ